MSNTTSKTCSSVFCKARCEASKHSGQILNSRKDSVTEGYDHLKALLQLLIQLRTFHQIGGRRF